MKNKYVGVKWRVKHQKRNRKRCGCMAWLAGERAVETHGLGMKYEEGSIYRRKYRGIVMKMKRRENNGEESIEEIYEIMWNNESNISKSSNEMPKTQREVRMKMLKSLNGEKQ